MPRFCITPASVAVAADQQEIVGLETIVVTAQKKAENLQEVPISVAAVTAGRRRYGAHPWSGACDDR